MKNVVFLGFGKLGSKCLRVLVDNGYSILYILTHKDLLEGSVDLFAEQHGIPYSYEDPRNKLIEMSNLLKSMDPEYLVSVNYRYILPKYIFEIPRFALNIHGSLLPKYRGRTPHVWSIINGESFSGVTCHLIDEGIDTGDIIEQYQVVIESDDTGYSLLEKFNEIYPKILLKSLRKLENGEVLIKQNEQEASYFGKRTPDMGYIDFNKSVNDVINFVRAQAEPYPGAYYYLSNGNKIVINKIMEDSSIDLAYPIGVISKINQSYYVKCKDGNLKIIEYRVL